MTHSTDHSAFNEIRRYVVENYDELHQAAAKQAARENPDNSLQASALVNEVVVKLLKTDEPIRVQDSDHFLAVTTQMMKHILVDKARHGLAIKAGGQMNRQLLDSHLAGQKETAVELLIIQEELDLLTKADPVAAEVVRKRCQGYSVDEAATLLNLSRTTAYSLWNFGRAWLLRRFTNSLGS